jgi:hypothetical protein
MAQFSTDFSEHTTGLQPPGWEIFGSGGDGGYLVQNFDLIGTKALNKTNSVGSTGIAWTSIGTDASPQVLAVLQIKETGSSRTELYLGQPIIDNTNSGYRLDYEAATGILRIRTGTTSNSSSVNTGVVTGIGDVIAIRIEMRGGQIRAKAWLWGSSEPSVWQLDVARTPITGYQGVFASGTGAVYHYYAVGTGTDEAPMPGLGGVTTLSINESDPQEVIVSQTLQLTTAISNPVGSTEWVSGTPSVATVSSNGLVTGVSVGSSLITATNNSVSDSITVNVIDPEAGLITGTAQYYDAVDQQIKAATSGTFVAISPTGTQHTAAIGSNGSYSLTELSAGLYDTYTRIPVGPDILTSQVKQVNVT